ncbi:hypothetical protein DL96DRAFT_1454792 [Flagelloscypha sp. PMI_526]|nr:hypothetical protein DL96DRAFT_1454792 [Flagelloscypha sp. PMI_526]
MSFFRGGNGQPNTGPNSTEKIEMAITELETVTDFFNRMVRFVPLVSRFLSFQRPMFYTASCHAKCISQRYAEPDLNKGEGVCIDRCVAKYGEVQKKVGEKLQARGEANQAQGLGNLGF